VANARHVRNALSARNVLSEQNGLNAPNVLTGKTGHVVRVVTGRNGPNETTITRALISPFCRPPSA
jgi:hypothetical protein